MSVIRTAVGAAAVLATLVVSAPESSAQRAPASPRDTAKATVSGAELLVDYGRPSKRGRDIFGGLVPWGAVWRAGANEATHFTTSKPLQFGATNVPAGTYTLYAYPDQGGRWLLIINKQTTQWGTVYDAKQDLARIPLTVEQTPAVVEQMEITITSTASGGELALVWDRTKAKAAFSVR